MISISIIIPAYNEEKTILKVLSELNLIRNIANFELIVINDGSTDNTKRIIDNNSTLYDKTKHLIKNQGKGKAIIEGLKISTKKFVFFQDADLEYDPSDLKGFINLANKYKADLIMGTRFPLRSGNVLPFWPILGNKFVTFVFNIINNTTFTDICWCYCLFERKNLLIQNIKSNGWGQHMEILTYLSKKSKKIVEMSVKYNGRSYLEGKKIRYYHVFEIIYWIIFTRIKVFFK